MGFALTKKTVCFHDRTSGRSTGFTFLFDALCSTHTCYEPFKFSKHEFHIRTVSPVRKIANIKRRKPFKKKHLKFSNNNNSEGNKFPGTIGTVNPAIPGIRGAREIYRAHNIRPVPTAPLSACKGYCTKDVSIHHLDGYTEPY